MKCPLCGFSESRVIDTRQADENTSIRRRRECLSCQKRFTTYEIVETIPLVIIKKDHRRESFDHNKLINGILKACEKRPISTDVIQNIAQEIENSLQNQFTSEIPSSKIGELVMEKLRPIDEIAYVRFASVYREFKDVNTFMDALRNLIDNPPR